MPATLVWITPHAENLIVKMARVSNPANEDNMATGPRLLKYLIEHKHWSPFEMASMCVRIRTERDIAAQILRHRSFSFQEFSTRYAVTAPADTPALRSQDHKNRQASHDDLPPDVVAYYQRHNGVLLRNLYMTYNEMLADGVAKETARRILPLCTPTTLYMAGTIRSWIHYLDVRCDESTQFEHRQVALSIRDIFQQSLPVVSEALWS
jgi:thymidylate synthase (FAD)